MNGADIIDEDAIEIPVNLATALDGCRRLVANPKADKPAMFERGATDVFRTVTQDDAALWEFAKETLYEIADGIGLDDTAAQTVLDAALAKSFELPGADVTPLQAWEKNDRPKAPHVNGSAAPPIMTADDMHKFFAGWRATIKAAPSREKAWRDCAADVAARVRGSEIGRRVAADQLDRLIRDLGLFIDRERPDSRDDDFIQRRIAEALGTPGNVPNGTLTNGHDAAPTPQPDDYGTITTGLPATIDDTSAVAPAKLISPAAWPNEAPPPVDWLVVNRVPRGDVTTLHGDGGAGKTDIALRLGANVARAASDWLGHEIHAGKVLFVSGEEPERELQRRMWQHSQCDGYRLDELADSFRLWLPDKISDAAMAVADRYSGLMQPTRIMQEIAAAIVEFSPALIIVDNVAATFAGNQNDRVSVRSYVNLWRQIAHGPSKPAVLLLDHPSLSGLTNGSGRGGNMDWRNAVRSALWLHPPTDGAEADRGIRILETAKSNYGPPGNPLRLVWAEGGLQLEHTQPSHHRAAKDAECEETFLRLLDQREGQGRHVSGQATAPTYAPKAFVEMPDNGGFARKAFAAAMERLLTAGKIVQVMEGPASRQRGHLTRKHA
ncbi:MAG TPA: AAA family ATPase [Xanthobacteraceae bacterium]|jgi:RecA-family ATPase|nr:AAA family ATPase [Xanthobacteraceae bacterium]